MARRIEILAPAGNGDMLRAAVFSGADAVYLGLTDFNARRGADNFTPQALEQAVCFCHARGVRVYVTLNTLLYAGELSRAADCIAAVACAGADALIVQDLAVARMAGRIAPGLALHASTQMSIHTLAGAQQAAALGFSRVILARELSLDEIGHITAHCGVEVEVFVHGALCMSVSGQCMLSAFLGGRSGNRGRCAGPCRLPFDARALPDGKPGQQCHLSLKDQSLIGRLPDLARAGVTSVKIEGRLRPPEYAAAAVNACVQARAGEPYDKKLLQKAFSRSGFTAGYLDGVPGREIFGVRTEADAADTKAALPQLRALYRRERCRVPVDFTAQPVPDGVCLTARDTDGNQSSAAAPLPPEGGVSPEGIRRALGKTGGTPFICRDISLTGTDALCRLPGGEWNRLRRACLERLLAVRERPRPLPVSAAALPDHPAAAPGFAPHAARFERWQQLQALRPEQLDALAYIQLPIGEALAHADEFPAALRQKTVLELPRTAFGPLEDRLAAQIAAAGTGWLAFEANNLAHLRLCRGLPLAGGPGLNCVNPLSAAVYRDLGCRRVTASPEATLDDLGFVAPVLPTALPVYGHLPLMTTRACPLKNVTGCARCSGEGLLADRKAKRFPVRCGGGVRTIYNPVPLYMGDKPMPGDHRLAWFTIEPPERCAQVLDLLLEQRAFDGEFTRGLYYKGTTD